MDFIDNLKKLTKNWRLMAIVIWLLIGLAIIPYPLPIVSIIGIIIFFPFLVFLMFLFLLSLVSKRNIFEYPPMESDFIFTYLLTDYGFNFNSSNTFICNFRYYVFSLYILVHLIWGLSIREKSGQTGI